MLQLGSGSIPVFHPPLTVLQGCGAGLPWSRDRVAHHFSLKYHSEAQQLDSSIRTTIPIRPDSPPSSPSSASAQSQSVQLSSSSVLFCRRVFRGFAYWIHNECGGQRATDKRKQRKVKLKFMKVCEVFLNSIDSHVTRNRFTYFTLTPRSTSHIVRPPPRDGVTFILAHRWHDMQCVLQYLTILHRRTDREHFIAFLLKVTRLFPLAVLVVVLLEILW